MKAHKMSIVCALIHSSSSSNGNPIEFWLRTSLRLTGAERDILPHPSFGVNRMVRTVSTEGSANKSVLGMSMKKLN